MTFYVVGGYGIFRRFGGDSILEDVDFDEPYPEEEDNSENMAALGESDCKMQESHWWDEEDISNSKQLEDQKDDAKDIERQEGAFLSLTTGTE